MMYAIGPLAVNGANLKMNDLCGGLPSPGGFLGFAGALARQFGLDGWAPSVLPVLHDVQVSPGRIKGGVRGGKPVPLEVPEDITGAFLATLLIDFPEEVRESELKEAVLSRRLCGGNVFPAADGRRDGGRTWAAPSDTSARCVRAVSAADGSVLSDLPRGYAVVPARELSALPVTNGADAHVETLVDVLHPEDGVRQEAGYLVPVAAGYRLIEEPVPAGARTGTRDAVTRHAFAEPLMTIGEMVSVRSSRLRDLDAEGLRAVSWRWHSAGADRLFSPLLASDPVTTEETST